MEDSAKLFKKKLKFLYKKIDQGSSLIWDHENQLTRGKRTRSEVGTDDKELFWKNKETTQTGYGEITQGSTLQLLNLFQNVSTFLEYKSSADKTFKNSLIHAPKDYNLTYNSLFLDIGSGFGKPVFHAALQIGCESLGIEVVPARVEFCVDFYYELVDMNDSLDNEHDDHDNSTDKISKNSDNNDSFTFNNLIKLNDLNFSYYDDVIRDKNNNLFLEMRINPELIYDNNFIKFLISKEKIKSPNSLLVENNNVVFNFEDMRETYYPFIKFGECFILNKINVSMTPIDDLLYSNLVKVMINTIYDLNYENRIEREILFNYFKNEKIRKIEDIVKKIDNLKILDLVSFINTIFTGNSLINNSQLGMTQKANIHLENNPLNINTNNKKAKSAKCQFIQRP